MEEIELNTDELKTTKVRKLDGDPKIGWFCNKKGLLLKTYGWIVQNASGIILLIHGLKSHTRLTFMRMNIKIPSDGGELVVDSDNYYIYKDSWIEKFNQNGYSVYALDLQGHGESQAWNNVRGEFSSFDDLVDDVIQYMNQIQDEISNDNQTNDDILNNNQTNDDILNNNQMNDESYDIVATKKKKLPMYVIGYSMGGNIALRMLQVLNKEKGYNINTGESDNYKKCKAILDNSNHINEIDNDMNNSKNDDPGTSSAGTSATANASTVTSLLSRVAPNAKFPSDPDYKQFEYINNTYRYDKFRNPDETKFKYVYELLKATVDVNYNINYMPKDIPLLFLHSSDDSVCHYQGTVSFHSKAKVETKNIYIFDKLDHAITAAPGNEEVLNLIINWINNLRMNDGDKIKHEIEDKKKK